METGITNFRKAVEINPETAETRIKLAEALIMSSDDNTDEALSHFKYVYDKDKNDYDALIGLSQVYDKQGKLREALEFGLIAAKLPEAPTNCLFFLVSQSINIISP